MNEPRLSEQDRRILELHIAGYTLSEIEAETGMPLGSVKAVFVRLRAWYGVSNGHALATRYQHHKDTGDGPFPLQPPS